LVISGAALRLNGNQADSFTLKGGLDKPSAEPTDNREGVNVVTNTADSSGQFITTTAVSGVA
jgi:hypothetical protein